MRKLIGLAVLAFVMCAAVAAQGFGPMGGPGARIFADFNPVVGAWADYMVTTKGEEPVTMRLAVVGKDGEAFWYEMIMSMGDEGDMVTKMLVEGDPQDLQSVKRVIVKVGDEPAMEMPMNLSDDAGDDVLKLPESKFEEMGVETIVVPAGTFKATHIHVVQEKTAGDIWVATDVGPYGMVKTTSEDVEMVLIAYGSDATTRITETPTKFEMPMMPFGMPKGQ